MTVLQNVFFKAIIIPIVLTIAAALLESATALVKGKCKGQYKYRAWIRQQQPDESTILVPLLGQSLETIRARKDVVEIEPMVNFDLADFGSLGIDLIIGAFAVDVASLVDGRANPTITGYVLIGHLLMLIGIILFLMLSHLSTPREQSDKRSRAAAAIGLGLVAMMIAFFVI